MKKAPTKTKRQRRLFWIEEDLARAMKMPPGRVREARLAMLTQARVNMRIGR